MVAYHASLGWLMISYAHVPAEDSNNWNWFVQKNVEAFPHLFNATERDRSETVITCTLHENFFIQLLHMLLTILIICPVQYMGTSTAVGRRWYTRLD